MVLVRRAYAAFFAILFFLAALVPLSPALAAPAATLVPPFEYWGLDTDVDGLVNWLIFNVTFDVTSYGRIGVIVSLAGAGVVHGNFTTFDVGRHTVPVWLPGWLISQSGVDGPYDATIEIRDPATGTTLDSQSTTTAAYAATDFDPPGILVQGPVDEWPVDLNGNGLVDELRFNYTANVTEAGTYGLSVTLLASGWTVDLNYTRHAFAVGEQRATVTFLGPKIFASGRSGPYTLVVLAFQDTCPCGEAQGTSTVTYTTGAYSLADFDMAWVRFAPPFSDDARDKDGNGLYDELVVHVPVWTDRAASVFVAGTLHLGVRTVNARWTDFVPLTAGTRTLDVVFDGVAIGGSGIDGPYAMDLFLDDQILGIVGTTTYQTAAYAASAFERPSATLDAGNTTSRLGPLDGTGKAGVLYVDVPVRVSKEGDFGLRGLLWLASLGWIGWRNAHLTPGTTTLTLAFSGVHIARGGLDGPWTVELSLASSMGASTMAPEALGRRPRTSARSSRIRPWRSSRGT